MRPESALLAGRICCAPAAAGMMTSAARPNDDDQRRRRYISTPELNEQPYSLARPPSTGLLFAAHEAATTHPALRRRRARVRVRSLRRLQSRGAHEHHLAPIRRLPTAYQRRAALGRQRPHFALPARTRWADGDGLGPRS